MIRIARGVAVFSILLGGCAGVATSKMHSLQKELKCGMSQAEIEAIVGDRLQPIEMDARVTHLYRSGMADLWFVLANGKLRSSQVIAVKGLIGTEDEAVVNHCRLKEHAGSGTTIPQPAATLKAIRLDWMAERARLST